MADRGQQRNVVPTVGVRPARLEIDVVVVGPVLHGPQLALAPHELTVERTRVLAVLDAIPRRNHTIETELLGKGPHHVDRSGGGDDHASAGGLVLLDQHPRVGLHQRQQRLGRDLAGLARSILRPALRQPHSLARQHHRRAVLAHQVEGTEQQVFARHRAVSKELHLTQGRRDGRAARAGEQGAIEIENRGFGRHGLHRNRAPCRLPKTGRSRPGGRAGSRLRA